MYERATRTVEGFSAPKTFIRGHAALRSRKVVLAAGALYLAASVLGIVMLGAPASAAKASGPNTGNGTFALDPATPLLAKAKVGTYTLRCIAAAANGGTFRLEDPDGLVLGDFVLPGQAGGSIGVAEQVHGTITDGGTDFVVGDGFDVTVPAAVPVNGLDRVRLAAAASADGSQNPGLILAYDVDASLGDTEALAYETGDFLANQLVLGAGLTALGVREPLRRLGITTG